MQTHRRITNLVLLFSRTGDLSRDHGNFTKCTREVYLEAKLFYLFKALSLKAGFSVHDAKMKGKRVSVLRPAHSTAPVRLLSASSQKTGRDPMTKLQTFPERTIKASLVPAVRSLPYFDPRKSPDHVVYQQAPSPSMLGVDALHGGLTIPAWQLRNLCESKMLSTSDARIQNASFVVTDSPVSCFDIIVLPINRSGVTTRYAVTVRFTYMWSTRESTGQNLSQQFSVLMPGATIPQQVKERYDSAQQLVPPAAPQQRRAPRPRQGPAPPPPPNPAHVANAGGVIPRADVQPGLAVCVIFNVNRQPYAFRGIVRHKRPGGFVRVSFLDGVVMDCRFGRLLVVL